MLKKSHNITLHIKVKLEKKNPIFIYWTKTHTHTRITQNKNIIIIIT